LVHFLFFNGCDLRQRYRYRSRGKRQRGNITTKCKDTGTSNEARGKDTVSQPNTRKQIQVKKQEAKIQLYNQTQRYRYR